MYAELETDPRQGTIVTQFRIEWSSLFAGRVAHPSFVRLGGDFRSQQRLTLMRVFADANLGHRADYAADCAALLYAGANTSRANCANVTLPVRFCSPLNGPCILV